jgi:hypothetical protein
MNPEQKLTKWESSLILNDWLLVKKNALIEKVMNDPNFTKPEKEIFINDLNSLDDENLAKYLELSNENYGKILEWIRVKQWPMKDLVEYMKKIDGKIDLLKRKAQTSVNNHEDKTRLTESMSASIDLENFNV